MIYFLARTLAGADGGSRAGADILQGMLAPGRDITVVCPNRCPLPDKVDDSQYPSPRWLLPPRVTKSDKSPGLSPKALAHRLAAGALNRTPRRLLEEALRQWPPTLVVQNGFPNPDDVSVEFFDRFSNGLIIVHSAPESVPYFQMSNPGLSIEWVSDRLRRVDNLAFVAPQIRDSWHRVADLGGQRTFVVPNTARENEAKLVRDIGRGRLRRSLGLPRDAFIVSCVGKVDPAKGQDLLVDALPRMVRSEPRLLVVFVGPITPFGAHLPSVVERMGLTDHVAFMGKRPDPYSFIRASDLLIHPSRSEGLPLVLLEAMILRAPVLATDVGGIPLAVRHNETGFLVPPEDPAALAEAFGVLAADPSLRERLVVGGEAHYWATFSRKIHRQRIQAMIAACVNEASG